MKKIYLLTAVLISFTGTQAQVSEKNIPANATIVTDINLGKLTSLMPVKDWNKSAVGKDLLKQVNDKAGKKIKSLADLGIALNGHAYVYYTANDSVRYMSLLLPVADAKKTKNLIAKMNPTAGERNSLMVVNEDSLSMFIVNDKQLLYVTGIINENYFNREDVALNHGIDLNYQYNYSISEDTTVEAAEDNGEEMEEATEETEAVEEVALDTTSVIIVDEENEMDEEESPYYKNEAIKKRIVYNTTKAQITDWFYKGFTNSINENKNYNAVKNSNTVVSFWMDEPSSFYQNLIPAYFTAGNDAGILNNLMPLSKLRYTGIYAHLLMDNKQAEITTSFTMSDEMAKLQKKLSGRKVNPAFLKYVNMDSALAYLSYAFDTKAYLDNFPEVLESTYGSYLKDKKEEMSLAAEFFSFLIDEEAIGKMVPGDAMLVFNGLYEKEVTYTDYTYDDDYNATAIEKTKMETLPKFLMMMSSEQNKFSKKLIEYGIKKEVLKEKDGYYVLTIPKSPMDFYLMYKDDVFFIGNEEQIMREIQTNSFKANVSAEERDFITNNITSMLMKPTAIGKQIAAIGISDADDLTEMMNTLKNMGNMRLKVSPLKNNQMDANFTMLVPPNNSNALTYFMSLINGLSKNKK